MAVAEKKVTISPIDTDSRAKLGIKAGDTVRVTSKIVDKGKTRLQAFEGLVIAVKHGTEPGATFTVRKVTSGVGVEKIFALYSPLLDKIEILRRSKTRRSKLYYIREKTAREIRRKMKSSSNLLISTQMLEEEKAAEEASKTEEKAEDREEEKPEGEAGENVDSSEEITEAEGGSAEAPAEAGESEESVEGSSEPETTTEEEQSKEENEKE